ncbi:MAG: class IV adenylate cyclase [Phycisphaerales bacterium]
MQNIEYKAELRDIQLARGVLRSHRALPIITVKQVDTHFRLPDGRLLKREAVDEPTEWIFYHRVDRLRPRLSTFTILTDQQARTRWGTIGLKPWITVNKTREIWMMGNVGVSLDDVEGLGRFLEVTAMVSVDCDAGACHHRVAEHREAFDVCSGELISTGYAELLAAEAAVGSGSE